MIRALAYGYPLYGKRSRHKGKYVIGLARGDDVTQAVELPEVYCAATILALEYWPNISPYPPYSLAVLVIPTDAMNRHADPTSPAPEVPLLRKQVKIL